MFKVLHTWNKFVLGAEYKLFCDMFLDDKIVQIFRKYSVLFVVCFFYIIGLFLFGTKIISVSTCKTKI